MKKKKLANEFKPESQQQQQTVSAVKDPTKIHILTSKLKERLRMIGWIPWRLQING